jgi:hypothetical protein
MTLHLNGDTLFLPPHDKLIASQLEEELDVPIETAPWPGFPSDLVAIATVIATQARGTSLIHEKLFNNRLLFVDKLNAMGAQIVLCDPHRVIVVGPTPRTPFTWTRLSRRPGDAGRGLDRQRRIDHRQRPCRRELFRRRSRKTERARRKDRCRIAYELLSAAPSTSPPTPLQTWRGSQQGKDSATSPRSVGFRLLR